MDRQELAYFLRNRREQITPGDVGLPAGVRRRTPGLRREEVAQLSYISVEYYVRLEQARGPHPSREVLSGLARALRLDDAERAHLYELAGTSPGTGRSPSRLVRQSVADLIDRLPLAAAIVLSADSQVLAWNPLAAALLEDFSAVSWESRNLLRRVFLHEGPEEERLYGVSDVEEFAAVATHRLRATAARYPDDADIATLVRELIDKSDDFAALWDSHEVASFVPLVKTFQHRTIGPVTLNCDILDIADRDQQVVIYTADPGSPSEEALRLLAVVGTQRMDTRP